MGATLVFLLLVCITGTESFHQYIPSKLPNTYMGKVVRGLKTEVKGMMTSIDKVAKAQESNAKALEDLKDDLEEQGEDVERKLKAEKKIVDSVLPSFHSIQNQLFSLEMKTKSNKRKLADQEGELKSQKLAVMHLGETLKEKSKKTSEENQDYGDEQMLEQRPISGGGFDEQMMEQRPISGGGFDEQMMEQRPISGGGFDEQMMEQVLVSGHSPFSRHQKDPLEEVCDMADEQGYKYDRRAQFCYKYFAQKKNWDDAVQTCEDDGGALAKVDTKKKMDIVRKLEKDDTYLGATDKDGDGVWQWKVDDSVVENFHQKGSKSKSCMEMVFGKFDSSDCDTKQHFVCELQENQLYDG